MLAGDMRFMPINQWFKAQNRSVLGLRFGLSNKFNRWEYMQALTGDDKKKFNFPIDNKAIFVVQCAQLQLKGIEMPFTWTWVKPG